MPVFRFAPRIASKNILVLRFWSYQVNLGTGKFAAEFRMLCIEPPVLLKHRLSNRRWNHASFLRKQLQSVVLGRIVACRDLNSARAAMVPNQDARRRRGGYACIEHAPRSILGQAGDHR